MNLAVQIDRGASASLQDQLFEQLRQLILSGALKPNTRIIATRFLAEQAGVSRTTALLAYERLISEGYLETRPAVGTFVCAEPPGQARSITIPPDAVGGFERPTRLAAALQAVSPGCLFDLSSGRVDGAHLLPKKVWLEGVHRVLERDPEGMRRPVSPVGARALCRAIADYLVANRGIIAAPEQVLVVAGKRQAINLVAHILLPRDHRVIVESPGDPTIVDALKAHNAEIFAAPVDEDGLVTDSLPEGPAALALVSPARQNPIGGVLSGERRDAMLDWARRAGAHLVEDDCDSAFSYRGSAPLPLAARDRDGRVFYYGSFDKTLGAGIGLGYLIVPRQFIASLAAIKSTGEEGGAWLEQMVVADLINSGAYDRHLRRIRKIYLDRRDALVGALRQHFGEARFIGFERGTQLTWLAPDLLPDAAEIHRMAKDAGIRLDELKFDSRTPALALRDRALVMGYAASPPDKLRQAVAHLAKALKQ